MATKTKRPTLVTPEGIARYPWVNNPNTMFVEDGEYKIGVIVTKKEADAFKKQLKPFYDAAYEQEVAKNGGKPVKKAPSSPIADNKDNEEGGWEIKAKLKAKVISRDGTVHNLTVGLFDSQGQPHPKDVVIGGGSKVKVAVRPKFWNVPAVGGFGMTLELSAVQIIDLQALNPSERSGDSFGFTAVEGGYVHGGETFDGELDQPEETDAKKETKAAEDELIADF